MGLELLSLTFRACVSKIMKCHSALYTYQKTVLQFLSSLYKLGKVRFHQSNIGQLAYCFRKCSTKFIYSYQVVEKILGIFQVQLISAISQTFVTQKLAYSLPTPFYFAFRFRFNCPRNQDCNYALPGSTLHLTFGSGLHSTNTIHRCKTNDN